MVGAPRDRTDLVPLTFDSATSFAAALLDDRELTLFLREEVWKTLKNRPTGAKAVKVRLFTFDQELPTDLIGFMAIVSARLAKAGVSVLPLAASLRDHFFVPADQADAAERALAGLRDSPGQ